MKKILIFAASVILIGSSALAHEGKKCCTKGKDCCKKESVKKGHSNVEKPTAAAVVKKG